MTEGFRIEKMSKDIEKVLDILNGKEGLITTLALHQEKIDNIPAPKVLKLYALMSGSTVGFASFICYLIVKACAS